MDRAGWRDFPRDLQLSPPITGISVESIFAKSRVFPKAPAQVLKMRARRSGETSSVAVCRKGPAALKWKKKPAQPALAAQFVLFVLFILCVLCVQYVLFVLLNHLEPT